MDSRSADMIHSSDEIVAIRSFRMDLRGVGTIIAISLAAAATEFGWAAGENIAIPYIQDISGVSVRIAGLAYFINPVITVWLGVYLASMSDNCTSIFGKRRPFIVSLAVTASLAMAVFMFSVRIARALDGSDSAIAAVAIFSYGISDSCHDLLLAPSRALMKDVLPPDMGEKGETWLTIAQMLGRLVSITLGLMNTLLPLNEGEANNFEGSSHDRSMVLFTICVFIISVVAILFVDEVTLSKRSSPSLTTEHDDARTSRDEKASEPSNDEENDLQCERTRLDTSSTLQKLRCVSRSVWKLFALQCVAWVGICTWAFYWTDFLGDVTIRVVSLELRMAYMASFVQALTSVVTGLSLNRINARFGTYNALNFGIVILMLSLILVGLYGGRTGVTRRAVDFLAAGFSGIAYALLTNNALVIVQSRASAATSFRRDDDSNNDDASVPNLDKGARSMTNFYYALINMSLPVAQMGVGGLDGLIASFGGASRESNASFLFVVTGIFGMVVFICIHTVSLVRRLKYARGTRMTPGARSLMDEFESHAFVLKSSTVQEDAVYPYSKSNG